MDLQDFIKETIRGIATATKDLQFELEDKGVIVNPPLNSSRRDLYLHEDSTSILRRVEVVDFDVAVTAASETAGGGKAGLKVFSLDASAGGTHARTNEQVSRVRFSVSLVLAPTVVEGRNRAAMDTERDKRREKMIGSGGPADRTAGY